MDERPIRITRTNGMNSWRAGCVETRTSGSEGGPRNRTGGNAGTAPRSDPYTCVPTDEGWLYLASVIDLGSRRLLGWSMSGHHDATLVCDAVQAAVDARGRSVMDGTVMHSDRGSEYTSRAFRDSCERLGLRQSVSRTGSCLDNAVAEAFFATLKVELVNRRHYRTKAEARAEIFGWIAWYNHRRLHSTIGFMPPVEWQRRHRQQQAVASLKAA